MKIAGKAANEMPYDNAAVQVMKTGEYAEYLA